MRTPRIINQPYRSLLARAEYVQADIVMSILLAVESATLTVVDMHSLEIFETDYFIE